MASISHDGNGSRRILFFNNANERKAIRLGKVTKRDADSFKGKLESLLSAKLMGNSPDRETSLWLSSLDDDLHVKLAAHELVEPRRKADVVVLTVSQFVADFIAGRVDVKPGTVTNYRQAESKLVEFFGTKKLAAVTPLDADKFRSWLKGDKKTKSGMGLNENSARSIVKNAKLIFGAAVKGKLLVENPFAGHSTAIIERPDRLQFVELETIDRVLKSCPNSEWRAIVALCRFAGLRCPSEVFTLRWCDVDFERGRMRVRSPKLEGQQGEFREVPLFPEVRLALEEHFMEPDGAEYVIRRKPNGTGTNLRTTFEKIVRRAGVEPWKKLFQNLRSSRETELAEHYPVHVVTKWLGNSPKVAMAHYLQVRDTDFAKAAQKAAQQPLATPETAPQCAPSGNEKPLVLQGHPTKQGVFKTQLVPPAGFEPAYQD